jgi:hypothetical protein
MSEKNNRQARRVVLDLPRVDDLGSLQKAQAAVIAAAAAGEISTHDALDFSSMLEYRRRTLVTIDFETRLRALEDADDAPFVQPRTAEPSRRDDGDGEPTAGLEP